ncbi:hypothetical protein CB0940_09185 [Cercospora beticola]|uniref:Uncharacterized protein n=1 Tax=Cercospora beticola TaxID=122368 RepID=A0A2G5HHE1_CERBT|nr:hypothetical protein CB0940_09185 [Cercospora beticola]PIA91949.1 hypothetical protein CB0940_09185 [Cercospora beticola]WPB06524.1 hypothetical protein RHO25_011181 [Cercospora beticola]
MLFGARGVWLSTALSCVLATLEISHPDRAISENRASGVAGLQGNNNGRHPTIVAPLGRRIDVGGFQLAQSSLTRTHSSSQTYQTSTRIRQPNAYGYQTHHGINNDYVPAGQRLIDAHAVQAQKMGSQYLMMAAPADGPVHKRQANAAYVDGNGKISNDCRNVPIYEIDNGTLSIFVSNTQYYYTTNSGVDIQPFVPSLTRGSITKSFRLAGDGEVLWENAAFDGGQAQFCLTKDGTLYSVFRQTARPQDCLIIRLLLFVVSSCARMPEYVSTFVQTQTTERVTVSNQVSTYLQTVTSTYQTVLAASTVTATATYQTTIPASTATVTTVGIVTTTRASTSIVPASTITTTAVSTQAASTITTTYQTTIPASTIVTTYQTTYPATTVVQTVVSTAPTATTTIQRTTTGPPATRTTFLPGTTVTATTVRLSYYSPPPLCDNQGVEYGVFHNVPIYNQSTYDPIMMKGRAAGGTHDYVYTTGNISHPSGYSNLCPSSATARIYNNPTGFQCVELTTNHRWYMYPPMDGDWLFEFVNWDDQMYFWAGPLARRGWARNNTNFLGGNVNIPGSPSRNYTINLRGGEYVPMRLANPNGGGAVYMWMRIWDPNGNLFVDRDIVSPHIVRWSCDGVAAPRWERFGFEEGAAA